MPAVAIVALIGFFTIAGFLVRRSTMRRGILTLVLAPLGVCNIAVGAIGVELAQQHLLAGLAVGLVAAVSAMLVVRLMLVDLTRSGPFEPWISGEGAHPIEDYVIWGAVGVPLILGGVLVVMAITGGLTSGT